jgi:uncharacterized alpha-E superfamily protein
VTRPAVSASASASYDAALDEDPGQARTGLLSRIAETLFWVGRYVERADDTARMVDVYVHRMLEEPQADEEAGCGALLAVLGMAPPSSERLDIGQTLDQLAYDPASPSAISGAVLAARSGARTVREVISGEMWECLNVTALGLPRQRKVADRLGPHSYLRFVRERAALFFGLADATMSHDDAWRFLVLGQNVERVDMTARMLLARMPAATYELASQMLLHACGAYESYARTRVRAGGPGHVAAFLVLDRLFPRSVRHALAIAEECLTGLEPIATRTSVLAPVRRMRAELDRTDPLALPGRLTETLGALQQTSLELSEAITERYFTYAQPAPWERRL